MVNGLQTRKEGTDAKKPVIVVTRRNVLVMIEMRRNVLNMFNINVSYVKKGNRDIFSKSIKTILSYSKLIGNDTG